MTANSTLHKAKHRKSDEFYTQFSDIENELAHYKHHFEGKTVYCNCDDPYESNFFKYFTINFGALGLKRLIATSYASFLIRGEQLSLENLGVDNRNKTALRRKAYYADISAKDFYRNSAVEFGDTESFLSNYPETVKLLKGSGDFRSPECVELLKQADVVVTNPPFSLFREYLAQLVEHGKKFLVLGNQNAITYKEIFSLLKDGKVWVGCASMGHDMLFDVPLEEANRIAQTKEVGSKYKIIDGVVKARAPSTWFTNLDHAKRHEELNCHSQYNPESYPKFDNYDAINVNEVSNIPEDYDGAMGVPITFLNKHNPDQFEIIKFRKGDNNKDLTVSGKPIYFRVLIRKKA